MGKGPSGEVGAEGDAPPMPIERVRVGRGDGAVRVHATLSEGRHRGVELRAVERDGRVQVELVARDPDALCRLQRELPSLRAALGDGALSIHVVSGEAGDPRGGVLGGDHGGARRSAEPRDEEGRDDGRGAGPGGARSRGARAADARDAGADADGPWEVL